MALEAQNNPFTSVLLVGAADPATLPDADPSAGSYRIAAKTDGTLWIVDSAGVATAVGGTSGLTDPMTTRGDIIIRNASNATARLAKGAAGTALVSDGTDVAYGAPNPTFTGWRLTASSITMTSGAAWTVPFASESGGRDTHAFHDTSTNNSRCTIPSGKAGLYRITFNVRFPGAFSGATWCGIAVNGSFTAMPGQFQPSDAGANTDRQVSMSTLVDLVATDYVQVGGLFCSTTRSDLIVEFSGQWLGA